MARLKWGFFDRKQREIEDFPETPPLKKVEISPKIRLVPFDKTRKAAVRWYQDPDNMLSIVGIPSIYTKRQIQQMYNWQNEHGFLYYIEYDMGDKFRTIGDVWLSPDDYAIVLDKGFRNKGIGKMVTKYFIYKAKKMNWEFFYVSEIFTWNKASQKMFTSLKFYPYKKENDAWSYRKRLNTTDLSK